jgi:hypothetical protein
MLGSWPRTLTFNKQQRQRGQHLVGLRLERTMHRQHSEFGRVRKGQGRDPEPSPLAALLGMLEAARVALVELSAREVFVELVDLAGEAPLLVEDLADYAEHGGAVTVIAAEAEAVALALRNSPGHVRADDAAWSCTVESLRKVAEHCYQRTRQGPAVVTLGHG